MTKQQPRGIRNANPGNIEWGDPWQGLRPKDERTDKRFAEFISPAYGIRALAKTLMTYQDKYGINTVTGVISRWAPPVENDTGAYIRQVQKAVGGEMVDMRDYRDLRALVESIIRHENGAGPLRSASTWYDTETINEGLRLAGVRPPAIQGSVTKETIGATVTGAVGVGELADAVPAVVEAIKGAEGHLSSGSVVRVVIGVVLVAAALLVAYSHIKRRSRP